MLVDYDPDAGFLDVNLQMAFIPGKNHSDSIAFELDRAFSIHNLGAQEQVNYESGNNGLLVLYLEDTIFAGDQLHILSDTQLPEPLS